MYELVNTSAPNGLVAGTHGFSTVAMTKGMPDAIRNRVENFCAYPHRVSSRDQRYWEENPVNWFHLMLPGGDHVVGRTTPAEFDYTGRTNRLAHVLYFPAKEMPLNGGAFVLASEEARLSERWSGDPRFLKEDKTTVGRLRMADPVVGREPLNWIKMFGPQGREYARRFAVLLASNISGAGKSIYFKTSAAQDSDGTQLFGLFSDLINLLPATMAPLATFSTFSSCVPSGVTCHLRGVFDRDRAFEVASALQPWVDCETCEVKHAELLPEEKITVSPNVKNPIRVALPSARSTASFASDGGQRAQNRQPQGRAYAIANKQKGDSFLVWAIVGSIIVVFVAVALILCILQPWKGPVVVVDPNVGRDRIVEWQSVQTNKLQKLESELDQCVESTHLEEIIKKINDAKKDAKNSFAEEFDESAHDEVDSVMGRYEQLTKNAEEKMDSLRSKADNGLAKPDTNATQKVTKKKESPAPKADADVKHVAKPAADGKPETEAKPSREVALKDLPNLKIVADNKRWDGELKDSEKEKLCEVNSLVLFYLDLESGAIKRMQGCLKPKKRDPMSGKSRGYSTDFVEPKSARWLVVYIPKMERAYWQWIKEAEDVMLFAGKDKVNLSEFVFGGDNEAHELFSKHCNKNKIIYAVVWQAGRLFRSDADLSIDRFEPSGKDVECIKGEIKMLEGRIGDLKNEINALNNKSNSAANVWHPKMLNFLSKYAKLDAEMKAANGSNKNAVREQQNKQKVDALNCFTNFPRWKSAKEISLSNIKTNDCVVALTQYNDSISQELKAKQGKLEISERDKAGKEKEIQKWKQKVRKRKYKIDVIPELPEDVLKELRPEEMKSYHNQGEVDFISIRSEGNRN